MMTTRTGGPARELRWRVILAILLLMGGVHCSKKGKLGGASGDDLGGGGNLPISGGTAGIKGFEDIQNQLGNITGIPPSDPSVAPWWDAFQTLLPMNRQVTAINAQTITGLIGVVGAYCKKFIDLGAQSTNIGTTAQVVAKRVYSRVAFGTDTALSEAAFLDSTTKLTQLAWARDATIAEIAILHDLKDEALNPAVDSTTRVKQQLLAICTSMFSSLQSLGL